MENKRNIKKYEGLACEIKDYRSNNLVMHGIIQLEQEKQLQITGEELPMPILKCGEKVKVLVYDSIGGFQAMVGRVIESVEDGLTLDDVSSIVEYEERRSFRVGTDIGGKIYLAQGDKLVPYGTLIRDISLKGMLFTSDAILSGTDEVWVDTAFFCPGAEPIKATVVRAQRMQSKELAYGVDFLGMEEWVEQKLCAFLFDKQREEIQRKRGLL